MSITPANTHPATASRHRAVWSDARAWLASPARILTGILFLGALLRLWMLSHDVPTLNSDEATMGLMALHLLHGQWATFYWGQEYMGSLEAVLAVPFLLLFGTTAVALRLATMLVGLAFIATVYLLAARLYNRSVALLSAALLAFGPPFFVVLSMRTLGGYAETMLFGNLMVLLALGGAKPEGRSLLRSALLGGISGLALWTDPLILPYFLAVGTIFWMQRRSDLYGRTGLILSAGFVVGASPAIIYNVTHGAATVGWILGLTLLGGHGSFHALGTVLPNLWQTFTIALPILAGSTLGGTQVSGLTTQDYLAGAAAHLAAYGLTLALAAVALALGFAACVRLARGWRTLRAPAGGIESDEEREGRQGEAALLLVAACTLIAFNLSRQPDIATAPRYLLPVYAATPVVIAQARRLLDLPGRRSAGWLAKRADSRRVGIALALIVCTWFVASDLTLTPLQTAARDHGMWIAGSDEALLRVLHAGNVHTVISNDYWEGLRLTFESGETIITVMMTSPGHLGFNRYPPYVRQGLADARPAYLELAGTPEAARDAMLFRSGHFPGYTLLHVGAYVVLLPPT